MLSRAGGPGAAGGALNASLQVSDSSLAAQLPNNVADARVELLATAPAALRARPGVLQLAADRVRDGGFGELNLTASDRVVVQTGSSLNLARHLSLDAPVLQMQGEGQATLAAAGVVRLGNTDTTVRQLGGISNNQSARPVSGGTGGLSLQGDLVELNGAFSTQGLGTLNLRAGTELRLRGQPTGTPEGDVGVLRTAADLNLDAPLVAPVTASHFTLDAAGASVAFSGGRPGAPLPLSAGGSVAIQARRIDQGGVLWAPFGSLAFNASESVLLRDGSISSVSGAGLTLPYGLATGQTAWIDPSNQSVTACRKRPSRCRPLPAAPRCRPAPCWTCPAAASCSLMNSCPAAAAPAICSPAMRAGPSRWCPPPAPTRPSTALSPSRPTPTAVCRPWPLGDQVSFGPGGPLPAGTYAVLPARYAMLDGAFLVRPSATTPQPGVVRTLPNGATLLAGTRGTGRHGTGGHGGQRLRGHALGPGAPVQRDPAFAGR